MVKRMVAAKCLLNLYQTMVHDEEPCTDEIGPRPCTTLDTCHKGAVNYSADNQTPSTQIVTRVYALTAGWRRNVVRLLECGEEDILKKLGGRSLLCHQNLRTHMGLIEAVCQPLGYIQKVASRRIRESVCPPTQPPDIPLRVRRQPRRRRVVEEASEIPDLLLGIPNGPVQFGS